MIDYSQLLEEPTRKKLVEEVLKNEEIEFKELYEKKLEISETNARHHMQKLIEAGVLEKKKKKGSKAIYLAIQPEQIQPLRNYYNIQSNFILFVIAGNQDPGNQVKKSIELSQFNGFKLDEIEILTSKDGDTLLKSSEEYIWITEKKIKHNFNFLEIFDFENCKTIIEQAILKHIHKNDIITDITGGTKIMTLALFIETQKFNLTAYYLPINESRMIKLA